MKKRILAMLLVVPFVFTACSIPGSKGSVDDTEDATEVYTVETESEITYELDSSYVGIWVTGENEDMTAITITSSLTWRTMNINNIEDFRAVGGDVKPTEDSVELYTGDEIYDTVKLGSEADTLTGANGNTYRSDNDLRENIIENYEGMWQTGENEDLSYLHICADGSWDLYPADYTEGDDMTSGYWNLTEDSLELNNGEELYSTLSFGTGPDTLDSSLDFTYTYVCDDYCDMEGTWVTGENEDTTAIQINPTISWQLVNLDEIEGFEETGGSIKKITDGVELYNGDELYDTLVFSDDYLTLIDSEGNVYNSR